VWRDEKLPNSGHIIDVEIAQNILGISGANLSIAGASQTAYSDQCHKDRG
jgi:hypothetical protein